MNTIAGYSSLTEGELKRIVSDRGLPLYSMMEHHLGWTPDEAYPGVPTSRPLGALCLASCESLGGNVESALPTAAAVELVLNFCEIHDDIQAGRISRDSRDTVWWKWGPAQAINAGDGMHALARLALLGLAERGVGPDRVFEAVKILDKASLAACEGRFMDLEAQERLDMSSDAYMKMAEAKSGSLYACAMEFGALAADADAETLQAFSDAGRRLGIAVQIADDMTQLASTSDEDASPSEDFMNKKKLYPVVRAFEIASPSERRRLGDYYFKRVLEPSDARTLSEIISQLGVSDEAEREIASRIAQAAESVRSALPPGDSSDALRELMRHLPGEA